MKKEIKEYMVIEDSVDYRTIAKKISTKYSQKINHARIRAIYLSGMKELITNCLLDLGIISTANLNDETFEKIMRSPSFHELMADTIEKIKNDNRILNNSTTK